MRQAQEAGLSFLWACQASQVRKVLPAQQALPDLRDHQGRAELKGQRVKPGQQDHRVQPDPKALLDLRGLKDHRVQADPKALLDLRGLKDHRALQVPPARQDRKAQPARKALCFHTAAPARHRLRFKSQIKAALRSLPSAAEAEALTPSSLKLGLLAGKLRSF
jgi:hypothetical protein